MINYDDIWLPVWNGLTNYTGQTVIQAESSGKQPLYPFVAIKKTLIGEGIGQPVTSLEDVIQTMEQDIELVLSITTHASTIEESETLSLKARAYFLGKGTIELSDHYITVVDALAITNRDVFLNIDYERSSGFDVRLRVRGQESYEIDVIEKVTINQEG